MIGEIDKLLHEVRATLDGVWGGAQPSLASGVARGPPPSPKFPFFFFFLNNI